MEPIRPKVFLSYSRKDSELIRRLAQDLRRAQVDTWLDDFEILTGDMLREKIFGMGIPACDLFFAYLTSNSTNSSWCRDELDAAFIQTYESKGVSVALFVDSDATRNTLRADLRARRSPVLNDAHYWPAILELSSAAWLALQANGRVVGRKGTVDARVEPFASSERYHWKSLLDRVHRDLFIVGANLRSWLNNEEARQALLSLLESQRKPRLTLILGTPEILRDLGGDGEQHLAESVKDLVAMRKSLSENARDRFQCFFHYGAATLSAVFCDPREEDGVVSFTPRWGIDHLPQRRLTCSIERRQNPELFTALFDSLFLMTQPNVPGLDAMVARIGV